MRRGGGSASNSRNKRTTERGIKLVRLLFQRTSRRNFAKYCILTVVGFVYRFKAIFDMDSYVLRSCLLDSHGSCQNRSYQGAILCVYELDRS